MNESSRIFIIRAEEIGSRQSTTHLLQEKLYSWQDEEWLKGWLIEVLRFDFYNKDGDLNQYCDVTYRAKRDPEYLEIVERLKTGL